MNLKDKGTNTYPKLVVKNAVAVSGEVRRILNQYIVEWLEVE
jgi:hypothetical protein